MSKINVCQVASEMVPFAKTGGLADVVGAVTPQLKKKGVAVHAFLPLYKQVKSVLSGSDLISTNLEVKVKIGDDLVSGRIWKAQLDGNINVYLIERNEYYHRDYLYSTPEGDYLDNAERFIFFSRATLEAIKLLNIKPDVIHCHDWQTALIPVYLKTLYKKDPFFAGIKTVVTVHNLAYQGVFWHWDMKLTGLSWELFNYKQLEFWGKLNFLKGGLVFADKLTTVSQRYSEEIQTPQYGHGLDGVLRERSRDLHGIINGVDYSQWSPLTDKLIAANYDINNLSDKSRNKQALQKRCNLEQSNMPLLGFIGRLADQKGMDLILQIFDELIKSNCQFVLLGTGEEKYHRLLSEIAKRYPGRVSINITFDNTLAHLITAGADMLLMPSKYEPCGLNQLYALKYGTIPIVHETGGLADTITNYTPEGLSEESLSGRPCARGRPARRSGGSASGGKEKIASGFSFRNYGAGELLGAIKSALSLYQNKKDWQQLMKNAMSQDWSWEHSSKEYITLYEKLRSHEGTKTLREPFL